MPTTQNEERPKTYRERREIAENTYRELYLKFRTHKFIDWGILTKVEEDYDCTGLVPPYCERFDEFLGYWLSGCSPKDVPGIMEEYFPTPDKLDCAYLDDIVAELEEIATWGKGEMFITQKGSKLRIGTGVCWCFPENVARAKKWVEAVKEDLQQQKDVLNSKPKFTGQSATSAQSIVPLGSLLQLGFGVSNLNQLLLKLGIITEQGRHTPDSKPRTWTAIIEALREKKLLERANDKTLHAALLQQFSEGDGKHLPSLRTIQRGYDAGIIQSKYFYQRAFDLLTAM